MKVVYISNTDPYWNLAAEEYFLKQRQEDFFLIWQNLPCIVVGKNQNTFAQINQDYVREHNLIVVRRLTGGGAVYHDSGNVNYSFILSDASEHFGDYAALCMPIIRALQGLGIDAKQSGRNDLLIGDKKFCGNAQTLWHGRLLHHGCILFKSDINNLTDALKVNPLKIKTKGIDSVRSRVTNISTHLSKPMSAAEFCLYLQNTMLNIQDNTLYIPDKNDIDEINCLREKYASYEWNYGFSKKYSFEKETLYGGGIITVQMDIKDNKISDMRIDRDFFGICDVLELTSLLTGTDYKPSDILEKLKAVNVSDYLHGMDDDTFLKALF